MLDKLQLTETTSLGGGRHLSYGQLDETHYLIASGFKFAEPPEGFVEREAGPGHLTAILSEIPVPVSASPYEVKDIVDLHDRNTPGYVGHDHLQIAKLFPTIRIFSSTSDLRSPWNGFFKLCLEERSQGIGAIDQELNQSLLTLAQLDPNLLPYRVMCRSIFDGDPSSFFLALYRCLESLYSFASAQELGRRFQIGNDWQDIAATLEDVTGWYPREESSLEALLRKASSADLERLVTAAGGQIVQGQSLSVKAAKEIYSIRNAAVHFRPAHQIRDLEKLNWSSICTHMVGLILDVYVEAGHQI